LGYGGEAGIEGGYQRGVINRDFRAVDHMPFGIDNGDRPAHLLAIDWTHENDAPSFVELLR
jgi:hypothetical protein